MNICNKTTLFAAICFQVAAGKTFAQNKLDSLHHLPEVVVTADAPKEVIPGQKLSGKELKKLSSFSVADAIRYFSGVQIKDYGGLGGIKNREYPQYGYEPHGRFL